MNPRSIAVIGASAEEGKVGHDVLKNLLTQGYRGEVFPINPKGGEILGRRVYATVGAIAETVDLAIIVTPAPTVPGILRECAVKGIRSVIVISAGFKETGTPEGKAREEEIVQIARDHRIDLLGPNCLGMLCPRIGLNASFAKALPSAGSIALISQSGALLVAILDAAGQKSCSHNRFGFSTILSIGNKAILDECDFLESCSEDPATHVVGLYLESIDRGRRFAQLAQRVAATKHIVLLKAGTSTLGRRAAASHTGALAGSDAAIDAVCAHTGIHRAHSLEEFMDLLFGLSTQPPLLSPKIAVVTNAGGPGILAADAAEKEGLLLPTLTHAREEALRAQLPASASTKNPIDVVGDAGADRYRAALNACIADPEIDGICVLLTPQVMTPVGEIAEGIVTAAARNPLMPVVASFLGGASVTEARDVLAAHRIPSFDTPERAVRAMAALLQHKPQARRPAPKKSIHTMKHGSSPEGVPKDRSRLRQAQEILQKLHGLLSEESTMQLMKLYDLPSPMQMLARSSEEAIMIAQRIGYPVVAKISSPQILHKTDVGGIRTDIETEAELVQSFAAIMKNVAERAPQVPVRGILLQKFLPVGSELIIGGLRDPSFGPLVMVGLGGIYTELFRDVNFRLAPVDEAQAYGMLQELKAWNMLLGMRGKPPANMDVLVRTVMGASQMLVESPQIQELDFNPVLIHGDDVTIADAKVSLE